MLFTYMDPRTPEGEGDESFSRELFKMYSHPCACQYLFLNLNNYWQNFNLYFKIFYVHLTCMLVLSKWLPSPRARFGSFAVLFNPHPQTLPIKLYMYSISRIKIEIRKEKMTKKLIENTNLSKFSGGFAPEPP